MCRYRLFVQVPYPLSLAGTRLRFEQLSAQLKKIGFWIKSYHERTM